MQNITTKNAAKYKYATVQNTNFQLCKLQICKCAAMQNITTKNAAKSTFAIQWVVGSSTIRSTKSNSPKSIVSTFT